MSFNIFGVVTLKEDQPVVSYRRPGYYPEAIRTRHKNTRENCILNVQDDVQQKLCFIRCLDTFSFCCCSTGCIKKTGVLQSNVNFKTNMAVRCLCLYSFESLSFQLCNDGLFIKFRIIIGEQC